MRRILVLSANPRGTSQLRLDREVRNIDQVLRESPQRKQFELHQRWALRPRDLQRALLDVEPEIVHFCGHGEGQAGIVLEDASGQIKLVSTAALSNLFELCADQVHCVVLNACYAEVQADAIVQHIDYVIGMRRAVPDDVAIAFASGFYEGLGTKQEIENAFQNGCEAIRSNLSRVKGEKRKATVVSPSVSTKYLALPDDQIPILKKKQRY
ncbi:hypothetical protein Lepto7375DRAFT_7532 [Leptolyngbya sp. PCC 7375]|nr:hypothetical protein Lepto7375DRAFT_7532 [Leptolyngbya sp. PCC 7375]